MLVAPPGSCPPPTGNDKTSLVAVVGDRTGALLELLSEFAVRGISLTRIESRPTRERLGVYSFSLDCEGHIADRRVGEALAALHRVCDDVRFLGSYPRADGRENKPVPPVAGDAAFAEAETWLERIRTGRSSLTRPVLDCRARARAPARRTRLPAGQPAGPPDPVADQVRRRPAPAATGRRRCRAGRRSRPGTPAR